MEKVCELMRETAAKEYEGKKVREDQSESEKEKNKRDENRKEREKCKMD